MGNEDFDYGPGLVHHATEALPVTVQDPRRRHRFFSTPREGVRFGANMRDGVVWSVCVRVAGIEYIVVPDFVTPSGLPCATIIPFPKRGVFAAPMRQGEARP